MFLFILTIFAGSGDGHPWWNYPGLEVWKFLNLTIFILAGLYLHRRFGRPIKEGLRTRRESIKRELQQAQEELEQAKAKLAEVETRFATLNEELGNLRQRTEAEAEAERVRLSVATDQEIMRIREQTRREIESAGKTARHELRKFAAQESVRLAEEILSAEIKPDDDARLTNLGISELGRRAV